GPQLLQGAADLGPGFDLGALELVVHLVAGDLLGPRQHVGDGGGQLPGLRVDEEELLLDAEREHIRGVGHGALKLPGRLRHVPDPVPAGPGAYWRTSRATACQSSVQRPRDSWSMRSFSPCTIVEKSPNESLSP